MRFRDIKVGMWLIHDVNEDIPWIGIVLSINQKNKQVTIKYESNKNYPTEFEFTEYMRRTNLKTFKHNKEKLFNKDIKNLLDD